VDSPAVLRAALELFHARHFPVVVAACTDALLELRPDDASVGPLRLLAARSLLALRRDAEAQAEIRECLRLDPQCAAAYRLLGELATRADELESAKIFLREAVRLAPDDREAHEWLDLVEKMARPTQPVTFKPSASFPHGAPQPPLPRTPAPRVAPLPRARGTAPPPPRALSTASTVEPHDANLPVASGFGHYLVECGLLSSVQLRAALAYKRSTGVRLGAAAVALGLVSEPKVEWASLAYHGRHRRAE